MKVAVVGGGAAGLFCAANLERCEVTVFEATSSCGNKLMLTGGGRCNYTNVGSDFFDGVVCGKKFLKSCLSKFNSQDLIDWFNVRGIKTMVENNRAFPATQKSASVVNLLISECKKKGVLFRFNSKIESIEQEKGKFRLCGELFDAVVVATGGKTFPKTGSTGCGNNLFSKLGIKTNSFVPKLGPIYADGTNALQGVSATVGLKLLKDKKVVAKRVGACVFTHFGISGPVALDCSGKADCCDEIVVDFLPEVSGDVLQKEIFAEKTSKKMLDTFLSQYMAKSIAKFICAKCSLVGNRLCDLTNAQIETVVAKIKNCSFKFLRFGNFNESWVSAGGVELSDVNPKNMEIKNIKNLFVIGEQLDVFGLCGGYNLQMAFSTAKATADYLSELAL